MIRREDGDSSLKNLHKTFPGFKDITITDKAKTVRKTPVMVAQISNRKNAIGFGPLDVAIENNLKVLKIDGNLPTSNSYPYHGTIGLVYKDKNLKGITAEFVNFAISVEAHDAITKAGGLPIK